MEFYPYKKGAGAENVLAMSKGGGGTDSFWVVFTRYLEVSAILKGWRKKFPLYQRGGTKSFTLC